MSEPNKKPEKEKTENNFYILTLFSLLLLISVSYANLLDYKEFRIDSYSCPFSYHNSKEIDFSYERLYGLNDLYRMTSGIVFPVRNTNTYFLCNIQNSADVMSSLSYKIKSDATFNKLTFLLSWESHLEYFANDPRTYYENKVETALGYKFNSFLYPYIGFNTNISYDNAETYLGFIIKKKDKTAIKMYIVKRDSNIVLNIFNSVVFNPNLTIFWSIENYPVSFLTGILIKFQKHISITSTYKTHNVLGGSYNTGIHFYL